MHAITCPQNTLTFYLYTLNRRDSGHRAGLQVGGFAALGSKFAG